MIKNKEDFEGLCPVIAQTRRSWAVYPRMLNHGMVYMNADTADAAGCRRQRPNWVDPLDPECWSLDDYPEIVDFLETRYTATMTSQTYYPPELVIYPSAQYNPQIILGSLGEAAEDAGVSLDVLRKDEKFETWIQWWTLHDTAWRLRGDCSTLPMYLFRSSQMKDKFPDQIDKIRSTAEAIFMQLLEDDEFASNCLKQLNARDRRQHRGLWYRLKEFFE